MAGVALRHAAEQVLAGHEDPAITEAVLAEWVLGLLDDVEDFADDAAEMERRWEEAKERLDALMSKEILDEL